MATDIQSQHFLLRKTPRALHPYIKIARLDRPIGTWLLLWPCLWSLFLSTGGLTQVNWLYIALFSLGALLMRSAGCVINDIWDRKIDAKIARTSSRPLPSGDMTVNQAIVFLTALLGLSLCILWQFNDFTIGLGFLSVILVLTYPLMKRITWWPQFFLGLTFNWGALMGWTAMTGSLALPAILLYVGGIFWTLAYDTIYAHQDKEDDALTGIKSTALLFGNRGGIFIAVFFALAIIFLTLAAWAGDGVPYLGLLPALHAIWQMRQWDMADNQSSLKTFRSNRDFGFLALLMFAI